MTTFCPERVWLLGYTRRPQLKPELFLHCVMGMSLPSLALNHSVDILLNQRLPAWSRDIYFSDNQSFCWMSPSSTFDANFWFWLLSAQHTCFKNIGKPEIKQSVNIQILQFQLIIWGWKAFGRGIKKHGYRWLYSDRSSLWGAKASAFILNIYQLKYFSFFIILEESDPAWSKRSQRGHLTRHTMLVLKMWNLMYECCWVKLKGDFVQMARGEMWDQKKKNHTRTATRTHIYSQNNHNAPLWTWIHKDLKQPTGLNTMAFQTADQHSLVWIIPHFGQLYCKFKHQKLTSQWLERENTRYLL